jgi:hypothetical protein
LAILPLAELDEVAHHGVMEAIIVMSGLVVVAVLAWLSGVDSRPSVDDRRPWWPGHPR